MGEGGPKGQVWGDPDKCILILDNDIITSILPINYNIYQKFTKIDIDFKSVVWLEAKEFSKLVDTNWQHDGKAIELSDSRKLYYITNL